MKKIISLLTCILIMMMSMSVYVSATDNNTYEYSAKDKQYTVEFHDSNLSMEQQSVIADKLVGFESNQAIPVNIWCDIFGHDLITSTASVITHKARVSEPRCKKQTYEVTACEDCDYSEQTLIGTAYIYCCAAD